MNHDANPTTRQTFGRIGLATIGLLGASVLALTMLVSRYGLEAPRQVERQNGQGIKQNDKRDTSPTETTTQPDAVEPTITSMPTHMLEEMPPYNISPDPRRIPKLKAALETSRHILGDDHPHTIDSIHFMGVLLTIQGQYDEALSCMSEALARRRRILGNQHPKTLISIKDMGDTLSQQGRYGEALPYFREALETHRHVLGSDHPDILDSLNTMGSVLRKLGRYEDALSYDSEALKTSRLVWGNEHPLTLNALNNMGYMLQKMGRYQDALFYCTEAVEISRHLPREGNSDGIIKSSANMANLLYQLERYDQALSYMTEVLEHTRRTLGDEHPLTRKIVEWVVSIHTALESSDPGKGHATRGDTLRHDFSIGRAPRNPEHEIP